MISPSLIALGLGAAGMLTGLFIGFAPEPHLAALRRARRSSTTALSEGDFVCLEGVLAAPAALDGPVSREPVAAYQVEHYRITNRYNRDPLVHLEKRTALRLAIRDQQGSALLLLDEGTMLATRRISGTANTLGAHWGTVVFAPEVTELAEHSILLGANVVVLGQATQVNGAWAITGRDAFLTDVTLGKLQSADRRSRRLGSLLMLLSLVGSVLMAWQLR